MIDILKSLKNKRNILIFSIALLIIITSIILINKIIFKKTPVKIGFVNTLTGSASTSTIKIRDIAVLAVEKINQEGGIKGRKIELIIKDDKFDPEEALRVDQELIDEGVIAIIGHSFSSLALKVAPLINSSDIIMICPTVKSSELTGVDDNFLRLALPIDTDAKITAQIASDKFGLKKMGFVYDLINQELSEPTLYYFKNEIERLGGEISAVIPFDSRREFFARNIAKKIIQSEADGIYIIADAIHTALICQHLKINNSKIKTIAHGWAFNDPIFINEGGNAVEGVISTYMTDMMLANEEYTAFEDEYKKRFGNQLSGAAQLTYEALQILFDALSKTNDPKNLKDTILKQKSFNGIDGKIAFDKYGDPIRPLHIMEIQNGKARNIGTIYNQEPLNDEKQ